MPRVLLCLLALAACRNESDPAPMSGATALPTDCAAADTALTTFVDTHAVCAADGDCSQLDALGASRYCLDAVALGADASYFHDLSARYLALSCSDVACGGYGPVRCIHDRCVRAAPGDDCDACPSDEAPVCTTAGYNARNACQATACLGQTVAHAGRCADGPACVAAGGTCHVRNTGYFCPDGSRFDPGDMQMDCAPDLTDDTCCIPDWSAPCTYFGVLSATLSVNPFTCLPEAFPVCVLDVGTPGTCERAVRVGRSTGDGVIDRLDVATQMTVGADAKVSLSGTASGDRSFTCTGTWSAGTTLGGTLTCTTCVGSACSACAITQTDACRLP